MTVDPAGYVPQLVRLCDFVSYYAAIFPERDAIIFGDDHLSYAAFNDLIEICAASLLRSGVKAGDRIAMLTTPRPEFAIVLMATQRIGAIWVGVNPRYRLAEIQYIMTDASPAIFFAVTRDADGRDYSADLKTLQQSQKAIPIVEISSIAPTFGISFNDFLEQGKSWPQRIDSKASANDPTIIVYTSGTTGRPKGALLSHKNLLYSYQSVSRSFVGKENIRDGLRILCNLPPNHIGCISEMLGNTIICGGTVIFAERFDPHAMLEMIAKERITLIGGIPIMLQMLFDHPAFPNTDLSSLRMIGWGGAPASRYLVERMMKTGAHLFTNYGLTEGGAVVSATPPEYDIDMLSDTVGVPDDSGDQKLVDDDENEVAPGESGEIWLRGPGVFLGYWNNPQATEATITPDGWLRTGDVAVARADGAWILKGRKGEMFKSGGFNVYPREIELAIEELPAVSTAAVVAISDDSYFEIGVAFVVLKQGGMLSADTIRNFLRQHLANYKIPKIIKVIPSLPVLPIGKVDKQALRLEAATLWAATPHTPRAGAL